MNPTTPTPAMLPDPKQWTDAHGDKWNCYLTLAAARRLKETQTIDLLELASVEVIFGADPLRRIEALAELLREQWTEAGLTYEDFAERVVGSDNSFLTATAALKAGLSDFFRRLGRTDLATVADRAWTAIVTETKLRESKAAGTKVGKILEAALERSAREIDAELDRALAQLETPTTGTPFGS